VVSPLSYFSSAADFLGFFCEGVEGAADIALGPSSREMALKFPAML
jgi:hypothetical protein